MLLACCFDVGVLLFALFVLLVVVVFLWWSSCGGLDGMYVLVSPHEVRVPGDW